jgi:dTDP-4-dehydrorhamnose reductase
MLVWIVGKDGLVGKSFLRNLHLMHIGSGREIDVTDPKALEVFFLKHHPTHIINCSAVVCVDSCENTLKGKAHSVNIDGVKNLALLCKKYGVKLIHISTDYVFDGTKGSNYFEEDQTNPVNEYGKTKLEGEKVLQQILKDGLIIRTASLYGFDKKGLIDDLVERLKTNKVCSFVTDQISSPTYVEDLVKGVEKLLDQSGVFHFVNSGHCSRFELLVFVKHLMQKYNIPIVCQKVEKKTQNDFKRAAKRPIYSALSTKKVEKYLDFLVRNWQEALEEYFVNKWVDRG